MKLDGGSSNLIVPGKYVTMIKTITDLCDVQNSKSNFIKNLIIATFEKSTNVKLKCPLEKNTYQIKDWLFDGNKILPKSFVIPGNVSIYLEFLTKSKSSSERIFLFSLKLLLELQKQ